MDLSAWHWLGIGLIFLVLELFITGIFLFWVGLGAVTLAVILLMVPGLEWKIQLLIFAGTTLGYVLAWSYFGRSRFSGSDMDESKNLNSRMMNYIGQIRPLSEAIVGGKGALIIDDSRWVVQGPDLDEGTLVQIKAVNGVEIEVVEAKSE